MSQSLRKLLQTRIQSLSLLIAGGGTAANEADVRLESAYNEWKQDDNGWVQLTPYGDFPHRLGLQRIQKTDAEAMVKAFNSLSSLGKRVIGLPFYRGHPDADRTAYPDDQAYGRIKQLEAREDGLYGKVAFNAKGKELINEGVYDGHSPYWRFMPDKNQKGVIRPIELISAGLTNQPNIPVKPITAANDDTMNEELKKLAKLLGLDEAAENVAGIETAINTLTAANAKAVKDLVDSGAQVTKLTTDLAAANASLATANGELTAANGKVTTLTTERDNATKAFNTERTERTKLILDTAANVEAKITAAERASYETLFANATTDTAYNAVITTLTNKAKALHTDSIAQDRTAANGLDSSSMARNTKFYGAINAKMEKEKKSYKDAFNECAEEDEFKPMFAKTSKA